MAPQIETAQLLPTRPTSSSWPRQLRLLRPSRDPPGVARDGSPGDAPAGAHPWGSADLLDVPPGAAGRARPRGRPTSKSARPDLGPSGRSRLEAVRSAADERSRRPLDAFMRLISTSVVLAVAFFLSTGARARWSRPSRCAPTATTRRPSRAVARWNLEHIPTCPGLGRIGHDRLQHDRRRHPSPPSETRRPSTARRSAPRAARTAAARRACPVTGPDA